MPKIKILPKAEKAIRKLEIEDQFEKQKQLFIVDPNHPSLQFKKIKERGTVFWQFRINKQYRAWSVKDGDTYYVVYVGDPH